MTPADFEDAGTVYCPAGSVKVFKSEAYGDKNIDGIDRIFMMLPYKNAGGVV